MKLISILLSFALIASTVVAQDTPDLTRCPLDVTSCSISAQKAGPCCSPTMGILVLVQQWIVDYGPSNAFTLHGLWPDTCSGGQGPTNGCDPSRSYQGIAGILQTMDPQLYDEANTYWPSYNNDNDAFWTHEWDKHGTCVSTLDPSCYTNYQKYQEVVDYFRTVLNLRAQYNVYAALDMSGITPGGSYNIKDFAAAIQRGFGVSPGVHCKNGAVEEVWLYFNVQGRDTYRPIDAPVWGNCKGAIQYPQKTTAPVNFARRAQKVEL